MFILVFGIIIITVIKSVTVWNKNNNSPIIAADAKAVTKRSAVNSHHHRNNTMMHSTTSYFITFEFESGDRLELGVSSTDYGMIAEGDVGKLTFQGTRFHCFDRK